MTGPEEDERGYVSRLWAEDWDSPEDAVYDKPAGRVVPRVLTDPDRLLNGVPIVEPGPPLQPQIYYHA